MSDRLKFTPEANPSAPCPICGAASGCHHDRAVAYCRSDQKRPKIEGWRPWGRQDGFAVWATLAGEAILEPSPDKEQGDRPSDRPKKSLMTFDEAMEAIARVYATVECEARQAWELGAIARQTGRKLSEVLKIYEIWANGQQTSGPLDVRAFLAEAEPETSWLIGDLLPASTVAVLYGDGGAGKSLLAYDWAKSIALGRDWGDRPTRQGRVLILQSDEPSGVTRERLATSGFGEVPPGNVLIERGWKSSQLRRLRGWLEEFSPSLVIIDSLAAVHRGADADENDSSYGKIFFDLRDLQEQYRCTFLVLHHANRAGGARGTTAIANNASEIFYLRKREKDERSLIDLDRVLEIPKTRVPRSFTRLVVRLDPDRYGWEDRPTDDQPATLRERLLAFLRLPENRGKFFEPEEFLQFSTIGGNRDTIRKALAALARTGLVEAADRQGGGAGRPYRVYRVPPTDGTQPQIDPSDQVEGDRPPESRPTPLEQGDRSVAQQPPDDGDRPQPTPPPQGVDSPPDLIDTLSEMWAIAQTDAEREEILVTAKNIGIEAETLAGRRS